MIFKLYCFISNVYYSQILKCKCLNYLLPETVNHYFVSSCQPSLAHKCFTVVFVEV